MQRKTLIFFSFLLLFVVFFSFSTNLAKRRGFLSDESSYFSIIQSLAFDGDLKYTRADILRIRSHFWVGPLGLFLKQGKDGKLYYAKSFAYPLLAAPFFRLFQVNGILLFSGLMILGCILMGFLLLRKFHPEGLSLKFALAFSLASVVPVYLWWITADLFNYFVMFSGLFFFFYPFRNRKWMYVSALFFSLAVFSKPSNVLPIGMIYLILLFRKDWKRFVLLGLITVLFCGLLLGFLYSQTGEINFMGGERRTFYGNYPFEEPGNSFAQGYKMSADNYWDRFYLSPRIVGLNLFYYFFGRFTGMFIYFFPAFLILLLFISQKKTIDDWLVLAAIVAGILFFILITPDNYFGGSGSVGNRYFLCLAPLFFFLGMRQRKLKYYWVAVLAAMIFLPGIYLDGVYHSTYARSAGLSFPIRLFPPEKTQYQTLQTNENPRSFGRLVRDEGRKYTVHFINDNYWPLENNAFWTYGNRPVEMMVAMPGKVKKFKIKLKNIPVANRVVIEIEHLRKELRLKPNQEYLLEIDCENKEICGMAMKKRYIYYIKLKSEKSFCPFFNDPRQEDKRILGVMSHVGFEL